MKKPEIPKNEASRIKALKKLNILDTYAEERFDRYTRLAKKVFDVPIALVSLVDENRQWFKSCQGLDAKETSREISFCGHAILGDETLVIENALNDERFEDNPLVLDEPNIRFYAGKPILSPDNYRLGTLCIIDSKPRTFTAKDIRLLEDISSLVEEELKILHLSYTDELTTIATVAASIK